MKAGRILLRSFALAAAGLALAAFPPVRQEIAGAGQTSAAGPVLAWNAFLGGTAADHGNAIAVDGSGNVYVAGASDAAWGKPVRAYAGGQDAFAAKLDPNGALLWLTFLGGAGSDAAAGIAVDASGNVLVAGNSDAGWGSPLRPIGVVAGNTDAFAAKLGPTGALQWHTFVGIGQYDLSAAIAVDASSNVHLAGHCSFGGAFIEAFAAKLGPSGAFQWLTLLGGYGRDYGSAIAVDGSGNIHVAGTSDAAWGTPRRPFGASSEAFAAKLGPGGALQWHTFLGGYGHDAGSGIAVDDSGNVCISGESAAAWGSPLRPFGVSNDAFAAKMDTGGTLLWNTFLGGSGDDHGSGIAVDGPGNVFLAGQSGAGWGSPASPFTRYTDAFAAKMDTSGALQWNTFYDSGGPAEDVGNGIAVDGPGNAHIVGTRWTALTRENAFAIKLSANAIAVTSPNGGEVWTGGTIRDITWTTTGTVAKVKLEYSTNDGTSWTSIAASTTNMASFAWRVPSIASAGCRVRVKEATTGTPSDASDAAFSIVLTRPKITLSRTTVSFGGVTGNLPAPYQTVSISNPEGEIFHWTAAPSAAWITATPSSGTGAATVKIGVITAGLAPGAYSGSVTFTDSSAAYSPETVTVSLMVYPAGGTSAPFGSFDTPVDGTTGIAGSLPVTGWALDDVETTEVQIRRDADPSDLPAAIGADGKVLIGYAAFVEGARPDVEAAYPGYPLNSRAGWGYMMLTHFLPNQGNGTYKISAVAKDKEGNAVTLGSKTFACDNAHATKPFGTIDTPAQGGDTSGSAFVNFGWALTPQTGTIPKDGSTIGVYVDSVPVGTLNTPPNVYNQYRSDVSTLFPGLNNTEGPVGAFFLDTTKYANGVHSIAWSVTDDLGRVDGIGSRYFNIVNTGAAPAQADAVISRAEGRHWQGAPSGPGGPIRITRGYDPEAVPSDLLPDETGIYRVEMTRKDRIEIEIGEEIDLASLFPKRTRFYGFLLVGEESRPLPIGSTLDSRSGRFSWMPGPGFLGTYELVILKHDGIGGVSRCPIRISITPR